MSAARTALAHTTLAATPSLSLPHKEGGNARAEPLSEMSKSPARIGWTERNVPTEKSNFISNERVGSGRVSACAPHRLAPTSRRLRPPRTRADRYEASRKGNVRDTMVPLLLLTRSTL